MSELLVVENVFFFDNEIELGAVIFTEILIFTGTMYGHTLNDYNPESGVVSPPQDVSSPRRLAPVSTVTGSFGSFPIRHGSFSAGFLGWVDEVEIPFHQLEGSNADGTSSDEDGT